MKSTDYPSVKDLLEAGAHFGHAVKRWNPKMEKYIYESKNGIHLFDLFVSRDALEKACEYIEEQVAKGKRIVFVGTKGQAVEVVRKAAVELKIPYVVNRWVGGTLTNWEEITKRIEKLVAMQEKMSKGEYDKYTKKEQVLIRRDIERLQRMYGGLVDLKGKPDILFIVDPNREQVAVKEAVDMGVRVVALADSNADPDMVDYLIPANDDALKSVKVFVETIAKAVAIGQSKKKKSDPKDTVSGTTQKKKSVKKGK